MIDTIIVIVFFVAAAVLCALPLLDEGNDDERI